MFYDILTVIGFIIAFVGMVKIKSNEYFSGGIVLIVGMIWLSIIPNETDHPQKKETTNPPIKIQREVERNAEDTSTRSASFEPNDNHWISDNNGVYLWNPQPQYGESITWSGGFVRDGNYKLADGTGVVTWYLNGEVEQVDNGTFRHGQRHGHFTHKFSSGKVRYSNWDNGVEIPDTSEKENRSANPERRYVGTYNSGMKAYIVPGTLKVSSDRKSCNVKISAEAETGKVTYLDYHIWKEGNSLHFSNSEGYSGVITSKMIVENNIWNIAQQ